MKKGLKITGIVVGSLLLILLLLVLTPFIFKDRLALVVKNTANESLTSKLDFSEMEVSFLKHFPHFTLTLNNFSLMSGAPFSHDTLLSAREVSFGVNLSSLISGPITITRVYVNQGNVLVEYNEEGMANYDVVKVSDDSLAESPDSSSAAAIKIESITFIKTDFTYSDPSFPMKMVARGINYRGNSDMASKEILRLKSRVQIDAFDFYYDGTHFLKSKPVKATLTTSINMNSLDMKFEKNNLFIKEVPFEFKGELKFRKDGYDFFISLFSMFEEEYLSGSFWMVSTSSIWLSAKADVKITLENWAKGFGVSDYEMKGKFGLKLNAQGEYATGPDPRSNKPDTVILSIPDFSVTSHLQNGYFKLAGLPEAISDIAFDLNAAAVNHDINSIVVKADNLKASFLNNLIEGYARAGSMRDLPVECELKTHLNLAELKKVVPLDSLELQGMLDLDLKVFGNYIPEKEIMPKARIDIKLTDGAIQTKYYPKPVEKISLLASIINESGKLSGTSVKVDPFSFTFEGNPFEIRGELSDPDNLNYKIVSHGSVDLARIYHLFSQEGMDVKGYIATDLSLKGRQSDATEGRYDRLHNSGKLVLRDIELTSEFLPKPFLLQSGVFRFENEKIWFEKFKGKYGVSDISLDGYLTDVVSWVLTDDHTLKGSFRLKSDLLLVDEFMAPEEPVESVSDTEEASPEGVIVIPENVEVGLNTELKKVRFQGLDIQNLAGKMEIQKGLLLLKSLTFDLIGCKVAMEATYGSINTMKAFFDFQIRAEDFDIKRAYNEVELIRSLAPSAEKCEGIVSLDYKLKGKLDAGMNPVYPSLEGGGTLSLKKVKVMGLKLFTSMSKNLERDQIKNPDLSKVDLKTTIAKNVITLERTKMKMAGFRFRIEGQTNFNGSLNLKARLGLPPLGIVGIPMRILGTHSDPKFKYGRGNQDEAVDETEYSDEIPPEMLQKIKNAKAEDLPDEEQEDPGK